MLLFFFFFFLFSPHTFHFLSTGSFESRKTRLGFRFIFLSFFLAYPRFQTELFLSRFSSSIVVFIADQTSVNYRLSVISRRQRILVHGMEKRRELSFETVFLFARVGAGTLKSRVNNSFHAFVEIIIFTPRSEKNFNATLTVTRYADDLPRAKSKMKLSISGINVGSPGFDSLIRG